MIAYGIDPGLTGALVVLKDGKFHDGFYNHGIFDLPIVNGRLDAANFYDLIYKLNVYSIKNLDPVHFFVEKAGPQPVQGVRAAFKTGEVYGTIIGVLLACQAPLTCISPAWKKHFGLSSDKEASRERIIQLFPAEARYFSRKKDHNRAEAALIALYGTEKCLSGK